MPFGKPARKAVQGALSRMIGGVKRYFNPPFDESRRAVGWGTNVPGTVRGMRERDALRGHGIRREGAFAHKRYPGMVGKYPHDGDRLVPEDTILGKHRRESERHWNSPEFPTEYPRLRRQGKKIREKIDRVAEVESDNPLIEATKSWARRVTEDELELIQRKILRGMRLTPQEQARLKAAQHVDRTAGEVKRQLSPKGLLYRIITGGRD